MTRKRRSNRSQPTQPSHYVMIFAYWRIAHFRETWWYRSLPLSEVLRMVARGQAFEVQIETDNGLAVAYQEVAVPGQTSDAENGRKIYRSPATLTLASMNAVAIAERHVKLTRAEQAQVEKVTVWPLIGDTKATAVRPRMSEEQRRQAEKLLGYPNPGKPAETKRARIDVLRNELPAAA